MSSAFTTTFQSLQPTALQPEQLGFILNNCDEGQIKDPGPNRLLADPRSSRPARFSPATTRSIPHSLPCRLRRASLAFTTTAPVKQLHPAGDCMHWQTLPPRATAGAQARWRNPGRTATASTSTFPSTLPQQAHLRASSASILNNCNARPDRRSRAQPIPASHAIYPSHMGHFRRRYGIHNRTYRFPDRRRRPLSAPGFLDRPHYCRHPRQQLSIHIYLLATLFAECKPQHLQHRHACRRYRNLTAHSTRGSRTQLRGGSLISSTCRVLRLPFGQAPFNSARWRKP